MKKEEIIKKLKANRYSFYEKDDQIIVDLTEKCHFIITLCHEEKINYQELVRSTASFRKNVSLKSEIKNVIIATVILLLFSLGYSYIDREFSMIDNPFFWTTVGFFLASSIYILYYYSRFTRIKKLLNLS
jgi:hypothetical protein